MSILQPLSDINKNIFTRPKVFVVIKIVIVSSPAPFCPSCAESAPKLNPTLSFMGSQGRYIIIKLFKICVWLASFAGMQAFISTDISFSCWVLKIPDWFIVAIIFATFSRAVLPFVCRRTRIFEISSSCFIKEASSCAETVLPFVTICSNSWAIFSGKSNMCFISQDCSVRESSFSIICVCRIFCCCTKFWVMFCAVCCTIFIASFCAR